MRHPYQQSGYRPAIMTYAQLSTMPLPSLKGRRNALPHIIGLYQASGDTATADALAGEACIIDSILATKH